MAKTTHIVYLSATHDAEAGDVVAVSPEQAERLVANKVARKPRSGEVKEAKEATATAPKARTRATKKATAKKAEPSE